MAHAHDDQVMGRNDEGVLATRPCHKISIMRNWPWRSSGEPEECSILPGRSRRRCPYEIRPPFWQQPLAVPHPALQVEHAQSRPVPRRRKLITVEKKIPIRIGF